MSDASQLGLPGSEAIPAVDIANDYVVLQGHLDTSMANPFWRQGRLEPLLNLATDNFLCTESGRSQLFYVLKEVASPA